MRPDKGPACLEAMRRRIIEQRADHHGGYNEYENDEINYLLNAFLGNNPGIYRVPIEESLSADSLTRSLTEATAKVPPPDQIIVPIYSSERFAALHLKRSEKVPGRYTATYIHPTGYKIEERHEYLVGTLAQFIDGPIRYSATRLEHESDHRSVFIVATLTDLASGKLTLSDVTGTNEVKLWFEGKEVIGVTEDAEGTAASNENGVAIRRHHAEIIDKSIFESRKSVMNEGRVAAMAKAEGREIDESGITAVEVLAEMATGEIGEDILSTAYILAKSAPAVRIFSTRPRDGHSVEIDLSENAHGISSAIASKITHKRYRDGAEFGVVGDVGLIKIYDLRFIRRDGGTAHIIANSLLRESIAATCECEGLSRFEALQRSKDRLKALADIFLPSADMITDPSFRPDPDNSVELTRWGRHTITFADYAQQEFDSHAVGVEEISDLDRGRNVAAIASMLLYRMNLTPLNFHEGPNVPGGEYRAILEVSRLRSGEIDISENGAAEAETIGKLLDYKPGGVGTDIPTKDDLRNIVVNLLTIASIASRLNEQCGEWREGMANRFLDTFLYREHFIENRTESWSSHTAFRDREMQREDGGVDRLSREDVIRGFREEVITLYRENIEKINHRFWDIGGIALRAVPPIYFGHEMLARDGFDDDGHGGGGGYDEPGRGGRNREDEGGYDEGEEQYEGGSGGYDRYQSGACEKEDGGGSGESREATNLKEIGPAELSEAQTSTFLSATEVQRVIDSKVISVDHSESSARRLKEIGESDPNPSLRV